MAIVSASWQFADGDSCDVAVEIENDYPDALAEASKTCVSLLREAMVSGIVVQDEDEG